MGERTRTASEIARPADSLNSSHVLHLLAECQYADKLLSDIEAVLTASSSRSPFPKYKGDLSPAQHKVVEDYIARIRAQMIRVLEGFNIQPPSSEIGSIHAIRTTLAFVDMAIDELRPKHMRGYGDVPESVAPQLNGLVNELRGIVGRLDAYLAQGLGQDLQVRLQRLENTVDEIELLKTLERIITTHGLVEFRSSLSMILDRLEATSFEIALFGRVSSGKSSLLNHVVGGDVLPVGVNPITAVPTRLVYGPTGAVTVRFAEGKPERCEISRLPQFVNEQYNPGNAKHVTRIVVELPSSRLLDGVVLVDTPGLGSLATAGAAETLAYLPRCDLGVVLIDAGSTLTEEDLATIRALYEAAIPASILLSKADLLSEEDRTSAANYISEQISSRLGLALAVRPVSVKAGHEELLDRWFDDEILPLYDHQQELARQSLKRKIGSLREAVVAALAARLNRVGRRPQSPEANLKQTEIELRKAGGGFHSVRELADRIEYWIRGIDEAALTRAASDLVECWERGDSPELTAEQAVSASLSHVAASAANQLYTALEDLSRELSQALRHTAAALDLEEPAVEAELGSVLREMPRLDPGSLRLDLRPGLLLSVSKRLAKRQVESKLRAQIGPVVCESLSSYATLLEAWAKKMISDLQKRFNAHADAYRAQLERLTRSGDLAPEEEQEIRRDLETLKRFAPEQLAIHG